MVTQQLTPLRVGHAGGGVSTKTPRVRKTRDGVFRVSTRAPMRVHFSDLAGSTGRLTLTRCGSHLDCVQHAMARDRVVERGAEMRSLVIVARETHVRLGDVGGKGRALLGRPP